MFDASPPLRHANDQRIARSPKGSQRVLAGRLSIAFISSAIGIASTLLAEPASLAVIAGAIYRKAQSAYAGVTMPRQQAPLIGSDASASEKAAGSGVQIVLHLVKCSESLLICYNIPTEHLRFADMAECVAEMPRLIQFAQDHLRSQVVMGRCHFLVAKPRTPARGAIGTGQVGPRPAAKI